MKFSEYLEFVCCGLLSDLETFQITVIWMCNIFSFPSGTPIVLVLDIFSMSYVSYAFFCFSSSVYIFFYWTLSNLPIPCSTVFSLLFNYPMSFKCQILYFLSSKSNGNFFFITYYWNILTFHPFLHIFSFILFNILVIAILKTLSANSSICNISESLPLIIFSLD